MWRIRRDCASVTARERAAPSTSAPSGRSRWRWSCVRPCRGGELPRRRDRDGEATSCPLVALLRGRAWCTARRQCGSRWSAGDRLVLGRRRARCVLDPANRRCGCRRRGAAARRRRRAAACARTGCRSRRPIAPGTCRGEFAAVREKAALVARARDGAQAALAWETMQASMRADGEDGDRRRCTRGREVAAVAAGDRGWRQQHRKPRATAAVVRSERRDGHDAPTGRRGRRDRVIGD